MPLPIFLDIAIPPKLVSFYLTMEVYTIFSALPLTVANGSLDCVIKQLEPTSITTAVLDKIMKTLLKSMLWEAAFPKENSCDFIISLGGGAVLDVAIAISAMATNPRGLWNYVQGGTGKDQALISKGFPIVT